MVFWSFISIKKSFLFMHGKLSFSWILNCMNQEKSGLLRAGQEGEVMLRKSNRSFQKDQSKANLMSGSVTDSCFQSDILMQKHKNSSFFGVPGLFVGFSTKCLVDSDSARSPTSPLDSRIFSSSGSHTRSPKSALGGGIQKQSNIWDSKRVGLGIVDSLNDDSDFSGKSPGFQQSKKIVFGSQFRINNPSCQTRLQSPCSFFATPKSLPESYGFSPSIKINHSNQHLDFSQSVLGSPATQSDSEKSGKFRSCLSDSGRLGLPKLTLQIPFSKSNSHDFDLDFVNPQLGSSNSTVETKILYDSSCKISSSLPVSFSPGDGIVGSLSANEIELSEDYTCIISHGPNPVTTHIFGDCIVGIESPRPVSCLDNFEAFPSNDFLSFCYSCNKKLEEGKDIFMYRGEKAFCSCNCRSQEILVEEEMEKSANKSSLPFKSTCQDKIFSTGMAVSN